MEKRHVELSWQLLEHKCRYYLLSAPIIEDYEYDMLEKEYEALCIKLGLEPTVSNMVDFDTNRPCCKLVMEKLGLFDKKKKTNKRRSSAMKPLINRR